MSAQPLGNPIFRALDSNGAPLSGGLLYSYAAGTSTPLATYTDYTGALPNTNPVVLDSRGYANVWMAAGTNYRFILNDASGVQQWFEDFYPSPTSVSTGNTSAAGTAPGGRLTYDLSGAGNAVSTTDQTGKTLLGYMPYASNQVPLYDGSSSWSVYTISGVWLQHSLADTLKSPAAAVANSNYDLFVWNDSGTLRLSRGPLWTSDTARGTGAGTTQISTQDGRWVNTQNITNGPASKCGLYVGTIRTDGSSQGNDSLAKRHCWNMHNRATRPMQVLGTGSWTYATQAWRQANATASYQLDYVVGILEDEVAAQVQSMVVSGTSTWPVGAAIGVDSTSAASGTYGLETLTASISVSPTGAYRGFPGLGRHLLTWLEWGIGAGTATFYGTSTGTSTSQAGIFGEVRG